MSTRNTNIAPSKLGRARLPFEHSTVGNGYAASGTVKTYHMSREVIERRYGPIKGSRKTDGTLYNYKPREVKEMSRLDKIMETMTKDQYIALKQQGKTDMEIMQEVLGHDNWGDVFAIAKKKWGVVGMFPSVGAKKKDAPVNETPKNDDENPNPYNEPDDLRNDGQESGPEPVLDKPLLPLEQHGWTAQKVDSQEPQEPQAPLISVMEAIKLHDQLEDDLVKLDEVRAGIVGRMNRIREVLEGTMVAV